MTDDIQNQLLQVKATGTAAYEKLRKERFVEQSAQIFQTIHRTNLKTVKSIRALQMAKRLQESHKHGGKINIGSMSLKLPRVLGRSMTELVEYDLTSCSSLFEHQK